MEHAPERGKLEPRQRIFFSLLLFALLLPGCHAPEIDRDDSHAERVFKRILGKLLPYKQLSEEELFLMKQEFKRHNQKEERRIENFGRLWLHPGEIYFVENPETVVEVIFDPFMMGCLVFFDLEDDQKMAVACVHEQTKIFEAPAEFSSWKKFKVICFGTTPELSFFLSQLGVQNAKIVKRHASYSSEEQLALKKGGYLVIGKKKTTYSNDGVLIETITEPDFVKVDPALREVYLNSEEGAGELLRVRFGEGKRSP